MKTLITFILVVFPLLACSSLAAGQSRPQLQSADAADQSTTPLRAAPVAAILRATTREIHRVKPLPIGQRGVPTTDPVVQLTASRPFKAATTTEPSSFEGIGSTNYPIPSTPSDTTGAAGPTQYVQWVNKALAVFDKDTGRMTGPFDGKVLWRNFARKPNGLLHPCEKFNNGDPIVQYDKIRERWVLSQFAVDEGPPYYECIAISTSRDALGSYYRYAYKFNKFNDFPKFGVWPNGYYASFNMFEPNERPIGGKACVFNAAKMVAGDSTAEMICFDTSAGGLLPADFDGPGDKPPNGGAFFAGFTRTEFLDLWKLTPDWNAKPATATFTGPLYIPVSPFNVACLGPRSCIPQKGTTTRLEALGDRLSYRLSYRRFADHDSLIAIHSVHVPGREGRGRTGIRWYEIRNLDAARPEVYQASTYAPDDGVYRWMGSAAMDKLGNLAIGYSASGENLFPSIRYAGRFASDDRNTLSMEVNAMDGAGAQVGADRWGDYSSMTLDPEDDCTFWFTTEYLKRDGAFNWSTRIIRFRFSNCR